MASSALNDSKITDYFPPSPSLDDSKCEHSAQKEEVSDVASTRVSTDNDQLSNSSVVITPKSSPDKDQTGDTEETASISNKQGEITKDPECKKTLTKKLEQEAEKDLQRPKSRKKGRKKKQTSKQTDTGKTDVTNNDTTNSPAKPKAPRKKKTESDGLKNTLVTDYFPVRRSDRKSKTELQKEKDEGLFNKILSGCEDGLQVEDIENKGRGVMATKKFLRGDFVVEYSGDLISIPEAKERDAKYSKDPTKGCYMYYFQFKNKKYCIDATAESGKLGRLLNHSKTKGNCHTKLVDVRGQPYLILVASRDISEGEELLYDYGDRSKASVDSHPWLKS
ncbi:N-lysine methyltransferase KMT5A-like [Mercenaria mercenaria]|uniref:N-lysine methyltransferase KMT5A-like n=1 Tax=Mercenaria mercenaria TaxID=6596 RepID=UPI001E1E1E45|nr:N-lysine methyltransferase KMT5A-like [Mercenaria mercenaria]